MSLSTLRSILFCAVLLALSSVGCGTVVVSAKTVTQSTSDAHGLIDASIGADVSDQHRGLGGKKDNIDITIIDVHNDCSHLLSLSLASLFLLSCRPVLLVSRQSLLRSLGYPRPIADVLPKRTIGILRRAIQPDAAAGACLYQANLSAHHINTFCYYTSDAAGARIERVKGSVVLNIGGGSPGELINHYCDVMFDPYPVVHWHARITRHRPM